jgi:hypothetical protein
MRAIASVALLLSVLAAAPVVGSVTNEPDRIGVFFDEAATLPRDCHHAAFTGLTAYLVVLNPTSDIGGWECRFAADTWPLPAAVTWGIRGEGLNLLPSPDFQVALSPALPAAPVVTLVSLGTFYLGGPLTFLVGATTPTSFPGDPGPGYAPADAPGTWRRLVPWTGTPSATTPVVWGVAEVGCVPNDAASWSAVKALYR